MEFTMLNKRLRSSLRNLTAPLTTAALCLSVNSVSANSVPVFTADLEEVRGQIDRGQYLQAKQQIHSLMQEQDMQPPAGIADSGDALAFEAERMRRIEMEFTLPTEELLPSIQRYIPDATEADVKRWDEQGLLEHKVIDGQRRYFRKAAYNLMHISDEAVARASDSKRFTDKAPLYQLHSHHRDVLGASAPLRQRIQVTYRLKVDSDAVPAGETVRAWLPFPQEINGRQENVALITASPSAHKLAPPTQPQRTIYFEKEARKGTPTEFTVSYAFDSLSSHTLIDAAEVTAITPTESLAPYLEERLPHVAFTPAMHALSQEIVGDESNPYRIAQKLFAYVDEIPWAGAREYSTIRNISQYAATAGHADCGQQTLLLITLMRMNGIPARWQSGWEFSPETFDTMHDWGEFYLPPYGWMPMDVTHGLLDSDKDAERWFYLGGLDSYRLIFNSDYSRDLTPAKQYFRSETVDSQRGEVEWRGGNLYFDQWDYSMEWKLVEKP